MKNFRWPGTWPENQATPEKLKGQNHYGFEVDGIAEVGYSLKNATGEVVQAYIRQTSRKGFLRGILRKSIHAETVLSEYLPGANYLWVGNEKGCDYLNNGHLALTLCPPSRKRRTHLREFNAPLATAKRV